MKMYKKIFTVSVLLTVSACLFAQEATVESEYLNDVDAEIIMSLANSDAYDNKLVALQYLQSAIEEGNTSEGIIQALDKLAGEGLFSQDREKNRIINNFPDIRRDACYLLAKIPTEHSKNTLVSIALADNEPMVAGAAIHALGEIGINKNDEVTDAISFCTRRNQVLNPTSSMALETLNAYELLWDKTDNKRSVIDSIARIAVDYNYVTPVRQKAQKLLKEKSTELKEDSKKNKQ